MTGIDFIQSFPNEEREELTKIYNDSYSYTLNRYDQLLPDHQTRTLSELSPDIIDLTAYDLPQQAEDFVLRISNDAYEMSLSDYIEMIDNELNGENAALYEGEDNMVMRYAVNARETAKFFMENPGLLAVDENVSGGRIQCGAAFYGGLVTASAILGGAVGFLVGSALAPGLGSAYGAFTGAKIGMAALGAVLGGGGAALATRVYCDNENQRLRNTSNSGFTDPYGRLGTNLGNLTAHDLLPKGNKFRGTPVKLLRLF